MLYMIGYDEKRPKGEEWAEFDCNSTEDVYLRTFIELAVVDRYPKLYAKMEDQIYMEWFRLDELSQADFMKVVYAVREYDQKGQFPQGIEIGAGIWNDFIEPLIVIDERYDPDYVLVD